MEHALRRAAVRRPGHRARVTKKGFGYSPAENDEEDCLHAPGVFDPPTGAAKPKARGWTNVFGDEIVALGARAPRRRGDHRGDAAPDRA